MTDKEALLVALEALHYCEALNRDVDERKMQAITVIRKLWTEHAMREVQRLGQEPVAHWSDCAVHSEPAYPKGECDCGGIVAVADYTALADKYVALSDKYVALKEQRTEQEPVADRAFLERTLIAMEGVIDVADRKTDEFEALRRCVVDLTLMLHSTPQRTEQNFCPRCGKRTADLTVIHTCTPPREST